MSYVPIQGLGLEQPLKSLIFQRALEITTQNLVADPLVLAKWKWTLKASVTGKNFVLLTSGKLFSEVKATPAGTSTVRLERSDDDIAYSFQTMQNQGFTTGFVGRDATLNNVQDFDTPAAGTEGFIRLVLFSDNVANTAFARDIDFQIGFISPFQSPFTRLV